jgi:hypothetical protein
MGVVNWILRRRAIDRDLDAEIRSHLDMAIADRVASGEDPAAARLAAMKEFGNTLQAGEDARQVWRGRLVAMAADVWQDARFGARMLIKNPAFCRDLQPLQGTRAQAAPRRHRLRRHVGHARADHRRPRHRRLVTGLSRPESAR